LGVKRSILTDRRGLPIGVTVSGANTHDVKLLFATLDSIPIRRPSSRRGRRQHLCGDLAYDSEPDRKRLRRRGYTPHIRSRGAEIVAKRTQGKRARRWVVERAASWLNRYRRILVRWEKKADNYLGLLHLVCAHVIWRNC
jgi:putative transposase